MTRRYDRAGPNRGDKSEAARPGDKGGSPPGAVFPKWLVMIFKFIPQTAGGHVHVAVFCATAFEQSFGKMGDLTLRVGAEWAAFRSHLLHAGGGDERPDGTILVEATGDDEP